MAGLDRQHLGAQYVISSCKYSTARDPLLQQREMAGQGSERHLANRHSQTIRARRCVVALRAVPPTACLGIRARRGARMQTDGSPTPAEHVRSVRQRRVFGFPHAIAYYERHQVVDDDRVCPFDPILSEPNCVGVY